MSVAETIRRMDDALIDRVFQPVVNRLPGRMTGWSIGMNCQLGSLIFQLTYIIVPLFFTSMSLNASIRSILVLLASIILFVGFQRLRPLVRPNTMNPLREMLRSLRMLSIVFVLYSGWQIYASADASAFWDNLYFISQFSFVIGLYFMACQPRPPKTQKTPWRAGGRMRAAAR